MVTSWLVHLFPDRAIRARAPAGIEHALRCSFGAKHFTFTVPLSTQVYNWVPLKLMLKVTWDVLASNPGRS